MLSTVLALLTASAGDGFLEGCPAPVLPSARFTHGELLVAPGGGVVTAATDEVLQARLCVFENHLVRELALEVKRPRGRQVQPGDPLTPGQPLAHRAAVTLDGLSPARFFREHPFLYDPRQEPVLVVVDVEAHQAQRYERGVRTHAWEVGRGQAAGAKTVRGDLKTPRGLYFVTDKSTGPFGGAFAGYYGGHWVKVSYPNAFDGRRGVEEGVLSADQASTIASTWWRRRLPMQHTKLGGGIGFHGWIGPWSGDHEGFGLSWGCVVFHPEDVADFYARVPVGAAVVLR
ncbi:MAG: L,D-transpeptidase [Myxococcus sp.]|nr:L,D-transpeptidase [Myxococcus sp.]